MTSDTTFAGLQFFMNNLFALELVYCMSHILQLRSNRLCALVLLAGTNLTIVLHYAGVSAIVRLIVITLPTYYLFPVAWSKGPLNRRLLLAALPPVGFLIGEVAGSLTYSFLADTFRYDTVATSNSSFIVLAYSIVFLAIGVYNVLLLTLNSRIDLSSIPIPTLPFALLLMWSFVFCGCIAAVWEDVQSIEVFPPPSAMVLVSTLLYVFISFGALSIAREESRISRKKADAMALVRQTKHMREEILYATHRSVDLKRLRHELAAQIGVIPSLVEEGRTREAESRLTTLASQAERITKETNE